MDKNKILFGLSLVIFAVLSILSLLFAAERIIFADMAYQEVFIFCEKKPLYNWARPGSTFIQLIPLALLKLNFSLVQIIKLHSLTFILYNFLGFLFIAFIQKQIRIAAAFSIYMILITAQSFYWCQSEYQQGIVFIAILAAYLANSLASQKAATTKFWLLSALLTIWIFTFHPLIIFPVAFIFLYVFIDHEIINKRNLAKLATIFSIALACRFGLSWLSKYESGKLNLGKVFFKSLPHFYELDSTISFFTSLAYWPFLLLSILCAATLIRKEAYSKATLFILFQGGYLFLILVTHPAAIDYYSENMLLPLGFSSAYVFMKEVYDKSDFSWSLIASVIIVKTFIIFDSHKLFSNRLNYLEEIVYKYTSTDSPKVILSTKKIDNKKIITNWASGYESLLLSSTKNKNDSRIVLITDSVALYSYFWDNDSNYLSNHSVFRPSQIPNNLFHLKRARYIFTE
jgi:hypothetical protein